MARSNFLDNLLSADGIAKGGSPAARASKRRQITSLLSTGTQYGGPLVTAWTDNRIEHVRHFKQWVYIAISTIASQIAEHPPNISLVHNGNRMSAAEREALSAGGKVLKTAERRKVLTNIASHEDIEPVDDNHPLMRLFKDPNDLDTGYDLWYETSMYGDLTGNVYWWAPPNAFGLPEALWVIPSHWVWPVVGKNRLIDAYELRPTDGNYLRQVIPVEHVIHFKWKNPYSKIDGYSPLTAGANWSDVQESIDRSRFFSFTNQAMPQGAIELDSKYLDPDDEDLNRIESKFMARWCGESKAGKPLILPPGVKWNHYCITPKEMAWLESADQMRDNILGLFRIPTAVINPKEMTYGGLLAAHAAMYSFAINPRLRFFSQVATERLASRYPQTDEHTSLRVWWQDQSPQDPELLEKQIQLDLTYGVRTVNEVRAERGVPPMPYDWADIPWMQRNMLPADIAINHADAEHQQTMARHSQAPSPNGSSLPPKLLSERNGYHHLLRP